jgi:cell division protein FtsQ
MELKKRYSIKNILLATLWIVLGGATVFLLASGIRSKDAIRCKGVEISIHGVSNNFFVDKKDILNSITASEAANPVGKATGSFNLKKLEAELQKNVWIKSAQLFFDNNEILKVMVQEREPVARVFTVTGTTFYIDNDLTMLPLSDKFSARLPVFTNFPSDKKVLAKADSSLLGDIRTISLALQKDSFSMAMVEQVDITPQRMFEMIPKIGNQLIVFGDATDVNAKLEKLKLFYKEIMVKAGWNNYSVINVQYKNQVVAKRKGAEDIAADSLRSLQIMQMLADRTKQEANDSLRQTIQPDNNRNTVDSTMIQQSIQRDENSESGGVSETSNAIAMPPVAPALIVTSAPKPAPMKQDAKPTVKPVSKPVVKPVLKPLQKPVPAVKKPADKPKAVMQNKNDY